MIGTPTHYEAYRHAMLKNALYLATAFSMGWMAASPVHADEPRPESPAPIVLAQSSFGGPPGAAPGAAPMPGYGGQPAYPMPPASGAPSGTGQFGFGGTPGYSGPPAPGAQGGYGAPPAGGQPGFGGTPGYGGSPYGGQGGSGFPPGAGQPPSGNMPSYGGPPGYGGQGGYGAPPAQQQPGFGGQPSFGGQPGGQPGGQSFGGPPAGGMIAAIEAMERQDFGIPPTAQLHQGAMHGPTPSSIPGARLITTGELAQMMNSPTPPVLVDVLGGQPHPSLPGALQVPMGGMGGSLNDQNQAQLVAALRQATGGNTARPVVLFCLSPQCWLSYNATLRARHAGYQQAMWYRGGLESWASAGLPMAPPGGGTSYR